MHKLLQRLIAKAWAESDNVPPQLEPLMGLLDQAFQQFERDMLRADRAFNLAAKELQQKNIELHSQQEELARMNQELLSEIRIRQKAEKRLADLATHDSLTGLPNRSKFREELEKACQKSQSHNTLGALFFLDLDGFKPVNDTLGHHVGDQLLIAVAQRVKGCIRKKDIAFRLGGDEFTVVMADMKTIPAVECIAYNIGQALSEKFIIGEHKDISISVSIGISIYPYDSTDIGTLINCADEAMYKAKGAGGHTFKFYNPQLATMSDNALQEAKPEGESAESQTTSRR